MTHTKSCLYAALIGIANVIPGVSGGTMAVILNVYDKIFYSFSLKNLKQNITFLGSLGLGTLIGVLILSRAITYLHEQHYLVLNFCFMGLIIGSIPTLYGKAREVGAGGISMKVQAGKRAGTVKTCALPFLMGFLFMLAIAVMKLAGMGGSMGAGGSAESAGVANGMGIELATLPTGVLLLWLFFSCFVSAIAMILPGVSGSFMLMVFGCYAMIMKAVSDMNLPTLFVASLGIGIGGLAGIKLMQVMLDKHPQTLYFGILGLVVGSIPTVYPGFSADMQGVVALMGMIVCAALVYGFGRYGRKRNA